MVERQAENSETEKVSVKTRFREVAAAIKPVRRDVYQYIKLGREAEICNRMLESLSVGEHEPGADVKRVLISSIEMDLEAFYRNLVIVRIFRGAAHMYYAGFLFGPKSPLRLIAMVPGVTKTRIEKRPRRQEEINAEILSEVLSNIRNSKKWYRGAMAAAVEHSARPLVRGSESKMVSRMSRTRTGALRHRSLKSMGISPDAIAGRVEHHKKREVVSATFRGILLGVTGFTVGCLLGVPAVAISLTAGSVEVSMRTNMRYFLPGTTVRRAFERGKRYLDRITGYFSFTQYSEGSEKYQGEIDAGASFSKIKYDKKQGEAENLRRLCIYCLGALWGVAHYQELSISESGRIMIKEILGKDTTPYGIDEGLFSEMYLSYVRRIAGAQERVEELNTLISEIIELMNEILFEKQAIEAKRNAISTDKTQILDTLKTQEFPRLEGAERASRELGSIQR